MKVTRYFKTRVLKARRYLKIEWCQKIIENPLKIEMQEGDRIAHWGLAPSMKGDVKVLRVITLADGETLHNAFPDRDFQMQMDRESKGT